MQELSSVKIGEMTAGQLISTTEHISKYLEQNYTPLFSFNNIISSIDIYKNDFKDFNYQFYPNDFLLYVNSGDKQAYKLIYDEKTICLSSDSVTVNNIAVIKEFNDDIKKQITFNVGDLISEQLRSSGNVIIPLFKDGSIVQGLFFRKTYSCIQRYSVDTWSGSKVMDLDESWYPSENDSITLRYNNTSIDIYANGKLKYSFDYNDIKYSSTGKMCFGVILLNKYVGEQHTNRSILSNVIINTFPEYGYYGQNSKIELLDDLKKLQLNKYYHFSFDDVHTCLEDITQNQNTYNSIFENSLFSFCKELHDKFGTKVTLNCCFKDQDNTWCLSSITDKFSNEFMKNCDWLKFSYHSYILNSPIDSRADTALQDYEETVSAICRITGSANCIDRMPRLEGYAGSKECLIKLRDAKCGCIGFLTAQDWDPLAQSYRNSYYFDQILSSRMNKTDYLYDNETQLHFVKTSYMTVYGQTEQKCNEFLNSMEWQNYTRYVEIFIHENQLTEGMKEMINRCIKSLYNSHRPVNMMDILK